jgi:hypothetical protein
MLDADGILDRPLLEQLGRHLRSAAAGASDATAPAVTRATSKRLWSSAATAMTNPIASSSVRRMRPQLRRRRGESCTCCVAGGSVMRRGVLLPGGPQSSRPVGSCYCGWSAVRAAGASAPGGVGDTDPHDTVQLSSGVRGGCR